MHTYRSEDADTIVVALGSVLGTIKDTVDEMRDAGRRSACSASRASVRGRSPRCARARASAPRGRAEKSLAVGLGGIVSTNVRTSYTGEPDAVHTVIAGLGGRAITQGVARRDARHGARGRLEPLTFLDLDRHRRARARARARAAALGPIAESILRDLGTVAARSD
jgi:pyruvate ferredoxin oxidoreductase alpha subunit